MNSKQMVVVAVTVTLGALDRARELRAAIEHRDAVYRVAPSNSVDDVLERLKANHAVRAAVQGALS